MCWACYTPLTGGGSALASGGAIAPGGALGGAMGAGGAPGIDEVTADASAPGKGMQPWQMGVIGLGVLLVGYLAFTTLFPSDSGYSTVDPVGETKMGELPPESPPGPGISDPPPQAPPLPPPTAAPPQDTSKGAEFTVVAPPNAKQRWATVGILLSEGIDIRRASAAAAAAAQQALVGGRWGGVHVFVFSDKDAASAFRGYQRGRNGAPVNLSAIPSRLGVSSKVLLRYELTRDGKQKLDLPSANSSG